MALVPEEEFGSASLNLDALLLRTAIQIDASCTKI